MLLILTSGEVGSTAGSEFVGEFGLIIWIGYILVVLGLVGVYDGVYISRRKDMGKSVASEVIVVGVGRKQ